MKTIIELFAAAWLLALLASFFLGPFVMLALIVAHIVG
jgi:hypothetical protein